MLTKEKFIRIHRQRGYQIRELGRMVIITRDDYRAIWFFKPDGTFDESCPPQWHLDRHPSRGGF